MFPNYRTTAVHRRDKLAFGCLVAAIGTLVVVVFGAYLGAAYMAAHFIAKFW